MEFVSCDLCGANQPQPFFERPDRFTGQTFHFVTCRQCGLVYLNPRPSSHELDAFYPAEYECYSTPEKGVRSSETYHAHQARLRQVACLNQHLPSPGRLLDVGCATGEFLAVARDQGWQVQGVEYMAQAAEKARQRWALDVFIGSLETAPLPEQSFDAITLWDVLEHLPSPKTTLAYCRRLLKPGGVILFSIPNLDSFDRALFGPAWIGWDAPRHFNLFDLRTVTRLLKETGFDPAGRHSFVGAKGAFFLSLEALLDQGFTGRAIRKGFPLLSALLWPYRQLAYQLHRAPIITYAGRKANDSGEHISAISPSAAHPEEKRA